MHGAGILESFYAMTDQIKMGDRFYPSDNESICYIVSSIARFGHRITHVTLTAESDQLAVTVSIGEILDAREWVPAK